MEDFRHYLRAADDPRIKGIGQLDAYSWAERSLANPRVAPLFALWRDRLENEAFVGISTNGQVREDVFQPADDGAPLQAMRAAVAALVGMLSPAELDTLRHPVDHKARRAWMNPEIYMNRFGLRLDEITEPQQDAILRVLEATLSPRGMEKVRNLLEINHFLGEVVGAPKILNRRSYNFNLFGDAGRDEVWGWNFYGHHVCLNCTVVKHNLVLTPVFFGAEPNRIDTGPFAGLEELGREEELAADLLRSLPAHLRAQVQLFPTKKAEDLPPGRNVIADELLLAGAFQDNRKIPTEGARVSDFPPECIDKLMALVAVYLEFQPAGPLARRLEDIRSFLHETYFCWIGGFEGQEPFYYRIQSPVILIEFDHHAGVFLANTVPRRFHIHTLVRTPNGNDYGMALARRCHRGRFGNYRD